MKAVSLNNRPYCRIHSGTVSHNVIHKFIFQPGIKGYKSGLLHRFSSDPGSLIHQRYLLLRPEYQSHMYIHRIILHSYQSSENSFTLPARYWQREVLVNQKARERFPSPRFCALPVYRSEPACDRIPHTLEDVFGSVPGILPGVFTGHRFDQV